MSDLDRLRSDLREIPDQDLVAIGQCHDEAPIKRPIDSHVARATLAKPERSSLVADPDFTVDEREHKTIELLKRRADLHVNGHCPGLESTLLVRRCHVQVTTDVTHREDVWDLRI